MSTTKDNRAVASSSFVLPSRHTYSRWDYQDDRRDFSRWVEAKRPCKTLNWQWDGEKLIIMVEPSRNRRRWYNVMRGELDMNRLGWRWLVAQKIKCCRRDLRQNKALSESHEV